jgi:hypothetical protein
MPLRPDQVQTLKDAIDKAFARKVGVSVVKRRSEEATVVRSLDDTGTLSIRTTLGDRRVRTLPAYPGTCSELRRGDRAHMVTDETGVHVHPHPCICGEPVAYCMVHFRR